MLGSTTTRLAGGLDFTAIGGKRQGSEAPQSLRVEPWILVLSTRFGKPNYRYVAILCLFRNYKNFQNGRSWAHHLDS